MDKETNIDVKSGNKVFCLPVTNNKLELSLLKEICPEAKNLSYEKMGKTC